MLLSCFYWHIISHSIASVGLFTFRYSFAPLKSIASSTSHHLYLVKLLYLFILSIILGFLVFSYVPDYSSLRQWLFRIDRSIGGLPISFTLALGFYPAADFDSPGDLMRRVVGFILILGMVPVPFGVGFGGFPLTRTQRTYLNFCYSWLMRLSISLLCFSMGCRSRCIFYRYNDDRLSHIILLLILKQLALELQQLVLDLAHLLTLMCLEPASLQDSDFFDYRV